MAESRTFSLIRGDDLIDLLCGRCDKLFEENELGYKANRGGGDIKEGNIYHGRCMNEVLSRDVGRFD